jgi:hypothetical protein
VQDLVGGKWVASGWSHMYPTLWMDDKVVGLQHVSAIVALFPSRITNQSYHESVTSRSAGKRAILLSGKVI